ncbi:MAG: hypothetical protein ACYDAP_00405 [Thermoplasmataceae archaeon]
MKSYEYGMKKLNEALDNTKLEWLSTDLKRANLDYARGIALMLDVKIDYEKMEVIVE